MGIILDPWSSQYIFADNPICRRLLRHWISLARSLPWATDGRSMLARMVMIAITTRSSIKVKPICRLTSFVIIASSVISFVFGQMVERRITRAGFAGVGNMCAVTKRIIKDTHGLMQLTRSVGSVLIWL